MILSLLLFKGILDYSYFAFVSPTYSYAGFIYDPSLVRIIISYLVAFFLGVVVPIGDGRPSSALVYLYLLLLIIPILTLWSLRTEADMFAFLIVISYLTILIVLRMPDLAVNLQFKQGDMIFKAIYSVLLVYLTIIVWRRGGFSMITLDPTKIYGVRELVAEQVFYGLAAYANSWLGKVLGPAMLVLSLARRNYFLFALVLFVQIIFAGLSATKEFWIYPIIIIATYMALDRGKSFQLFFSSSIILALVMSLSIGLYTDLLALPAIVIERAFFSAPDLHWKYYEFFQDNPLIYMANTKLSIFADYPYRDKIPNIIGRGLWGSGRDSFANTGVLATGYMHFGAVGMIVFSFFVGLILKIYDLLINARVPLQIGVAVAIIPAMQLVNGDLMAGLLSHGIGLSFVVLLLIGGRDSDMQNAQPRRNEASEGAQ